MQQIIRLAVTSLAGNRGQIPGLPKNPRKWSDTEVERIAASLEETPELFDARPLLVVKHGEKYVILGGNLRFEGAKRLNWKEVPVIVMPDDMSADKLKEIAKTIKRHHSTVVFLLNQSSYMLGHPDVYPDFKVIYDNFLKAIENETCMGLAAGER